MNKPENKNSDYQLEDADNNDGLVPDDALQKVNPAAAERATEDHDPHNVAKSTKQYDTDETESKK